MLRCHILLRWGATPLNAITALGVNKWISNLRRLGYANTTVATIVKVLSMILTDAADEGLIPANPIRRYRRRGRRSHRIEREKVWATPTEVLRIAEQAAELGGNTAGLLIITAAWTGCRWGELTGLQRHNVDLDRGVLIIDARTGSLHESAHTRWLGSTPTSAWLRDNSLAPGDRVEVVLSPEGPQRADLAEDIAAALDAAPTAAAFFDSLAQFYRRACLRWIDGTKRRPELRAARIAEMVDLLTAEIKQRPKT